MSVFVRIGKVDEPQEETELPVYHRVNHDPYVWRIDPEVFRLNPFHHVVLTEPIQWLWRNMNPHLTIAQMTALMGNTLAFTNGTGVPGRNNYLTGDVSPTQKDPRFDQARICGGTILKEKYIKPNMPYNIPQVSETRRGDVIYFEAIDTREPLPTAYEVMERGLYFEAVNVAKGPDGKPVIHKMKSNWGVPVYVPLLVSQDSYYPVELCTKLPAGVAVLPSPYTYP